MTISSGNKDIEYLCFAISHPLGSCSTLILYNLAYTEDFFGSYKTLEKDFHKALYRVLTEGQSPDSVSGRSIPNNQFSFIYASTTVFFPKMKKYFDNLGFMKTDEQKNKKNNTTAQLHIHAVPPLIEKLEKLLKIKTKEKKCVELSFS
jgi:hypothetical protein